jgi:uncharacterized membrane protein YfcA
MPIVQILGLLALGLGAGALSGVTGIGGGIIIVPALVFCFGFSSHMAQGTTLAVMVPPIGILAAWTYYQKGFVDIPAAALVAGGFILGGLAGAKLGTAMPEDVLRKVFACLLIVVAVKMLLVSKT